MRQPERVAGRARGEHGLGRAAGALGVGPVRVEPEAERDADRVRARRGAARPRCRRRRSSRRRRARGSGAARKTGPSALASASTASVSPPTAAASSSVRPVERPRRARGASASTIRSPSTRQANERPARRRARSLRRPRPSVQASDEHGGNAWFPPFLPTLPLSGPVANLDKPGGCRVASALSASGRTTAPSAWCWFYFETQPRTGSTHPV